MHRRRRARALALQILYQAEVGRFPVEEVVVQVRGERPREDWPFIVPLAAGVADRRRALDRAIRPHLRGWSLERLSAIDRIILRVGIYELQQAEISARVVISEAVELAKRYGGEASARFVNGVLGSVVRAEAEGAAGVPSGRKAGERSRA
ncbi:MAG: transcription antitermination factor NusB [bacterium]